MAQHDQTSTGAGSEYAEGAVEGAMDAFNATSNNIQAIAGEILDISKQSFEHATQTLEKLRHAHGVDEVVAIQTNFVKETFENAARHTQKFSELITAFPAQIAKTYQDAWLKSVHSTVTATETVTKTTAENIDRLSDSARKTSYAFDRRENA